MRPASAAAQFALQAPARDCARASPAAQHACDARAVAAMRRHRASEWHTRAQALTLGQDTHAREGTPQSTTGTQDSEQELADGKASIESKAGR